MEGFAGEGEVKKYTGGGMVYARFKYIQIVELNYLSVPLSGSTPDPCTEGVTKLSAMLTPEKVGG